MSCVSLLPCVNLYWRTENDCADGQTVPEPDGAMHGGLARDLKTGDNDNSNNNDNKTNYEEQPSFNNPVTSLLPKKPKPGRLEVGAEGRSMGRRRQSSSHECGAEGREHGINPRQTWQA